MARNKISFKILDSVLEAADLFWDDPVEPYGDGVRVRPEYKGRGYRSAGFGLVIADETRLHRLLAAAGVVSRDLLDDDEDGDSLDWLDFARTVETDSMGRSNLIAYWPGWEITGLPEHLTD